MENYSIITGASGGLGLGFARLLAKDKHNLVLIARSEDKLTNIKASLEKEFNIKVRKGYIETIITGNGIAVMPFSMQTDIMEIKATGNKLLITAQTTGPDKLTVYLTDGKTKEYKIKTAGMNQIEIEK